MVVSGSSRQTLPVPSANPATVTPAPHTAVNPASIPIIQDPLHCYYRKRPRGNNKEQATGSVPLHCYYRKRPQVNKKEQATAATTEDPAARPNTPTPLELFGALVVASAVPEEELGSLAFLTPDEAQDFINQNLAKVGYCQLTMMRNTPEAAKEVAAYKKKATELEKRIGILKNGFTAKANELEAKMKSSMEAADRRAREQKEKIDTLTTEKASITQDLEGKLKAVSHELEQHKKILEKERAQISQFEAEKKMADVTATYNLLLQSFVTTWPKRSRRSG